MLGPMLNVRSNPDNISFIEYLYWFGFLLVITCSFYKNENLITGMCMPIVSCTWLKYQVANMVIECIIIFICAVFSLRAFYFTLLLWFRFKGNGNHVGKHKCFHHVLYC